MDSKPIFFNRVQKIWNAVELRLLVLLSLFFQFVLIFTGNRRKYTRNKWVAPILWFCYLAADSVATLALGVLSQAEGDSEKNSVDAKHTITVFWAPFLLMHLGGPDTITAYALADNELWSRHLLSLVSQVGVSVYIYVRSFTRVSLNFLWLVIFFAGVVKYGERSLVLYNASKNRYRDSLISRPDPGPNYAKFVDEATSREEEGYRVDLENLVFRSKSTPEVARQDVDSDVLANAEDATEDNNSDVLEKAEDATEDDDSDVLEKADEFFGTFKKLFADLILSFQDREESVSYFTNSKWKKAFGIVEIELGLVYDLFYTKSPLVFSKRGFFLRIFSCSSTVATFVVFLFLKEVYPETEVIITFILLVGAIFLEMYALLVILLSDRMMIQLGSKLTIEAEEKLPKFISLLYRFRLVPKRERWSNSVGQYNLFDHCLKYTPKRATKVGRCFEWIDWCKASVCYQILQFRQYLDMNLRLKSEPVEDSLKEQIYDLMKDRAENEGRIKVDSYWSNDRLKAAKCFDENDEIEFDQRILIWHMATDICSKIVVSGDSKNCILLSNYMLHLLITSPFMLPSGIGQIRFQDTCAETIEFIDNQRGLSVEDVCIKLSGKKVKFRPSDVKGDRSKSLLFDACRLADYLKRHDTWGIVTRAWLDMLLFAAAQCNWSDHADKLSQGGELLTHVWLLMAHFGMTDHFQISKGYIRAKLELK